jgi:hypothetical protein
MLLLGDVLARIGSRLARGFFMFRYAWIDAQLLHFLARASQARSCFRTSVWVTMSIPCHEQLGDDGC